MRSFVWTLVVVAVAACGVEGEEVESAEVEAQLRAVEDVDLVVKSLGIDGEACTVEVTGRVSCLSDEERRPTPIVVGGYAELPIHLCAEQADGSLAGCEEPHTAYECSADGTGDWCTCSGIIDCVHMALTGVCTAPVDCSGDECFCEA